MKFSLFTTAMGLFSLTSIVLADDPSAVLSEFYSTVPTVTGSALTALASGLASVESTWTNSPQFTSAVEAVFAAAPPSVQSYLRTGIWYESITAQPWYTGVPSSVQSEFKAQQSALDSVAFSVLGTPTSKNAAAPRMTGCAVAAAVGVGGVVGIMNVL